MQVAVVSLNKGRGSGGVARQHMRALLAAGHDVFALHAGRPTRMAGIDQIEVPLRGGILPVHEYLPRHDGEQMAASEMSPSLATSIIDDFERALSDLPHDLDVIVAHHANLSTVAAARVARRRGIPYVAFVHGTGIEPRTIGAYADAVWHQIADAVSGAAGVLVTTEYVRDCLVRPILGLPLDRFVVIPCGVDLEVFHPTAATAMRDAYGLPNEYVICPGALTAIKGPQNVVAATTEYADLAPTVFIGEGELRAELEARLGDNGRFLGFVPEEDKAALINEATLLTAAPNKREHFGIIYVEALAAGTVPAAYRGGGVDSIVTPHVGVLTDRTPLALGAAARRLLVDPGSVELMATQARRRAETHFDNVVLSRRFVGWLTSVVTVSRPAAARHRLNLLR